MMTPSEIADCIMRATAALIVIGLALSGLGQYLSNLRTNREIGAINKKGKRK